MDGITGTEELRDLTNGIRGILRVIPSEASQLAPRSLVLRVAPSQLLLEDLVGGRLQIIEHFATVLHPRTKEAVPCLAFRARQGTGRDQSPNAFAGWLRIQSQIRKHGFSGVELHKQGPILGTVVILYGDRAFFDASAWSILLHGTEGGIPSFEPAPTAASETYG